MIRQRLRQLADDCEERARGTHNSHARNLYHRAATDARQAHATRHLSDGELQVYWQAMNAQALLARWYDGGELDVPSDNLSAGFVPLQSVSQQHESAPANIDLTAPGIVGQSVQQSACPPDALDVAALADLFGMTRRGAREAIRRNAERGRSGFYRDGWRWFADREAFARARRRNAEFVPFARAMALQAHDSADHP